MSSIDVIVSLDEQVIAGIAAGEVVERPASVVKELVENSLDAGASRITIEVADGERHRIVVTDDGRGIAAEQLTLALRRHATSKIRDLDDLAEIRTLGFRGEALASIAAVSELELTTRTRAADTAASVVVKTGTVLDVREAAFARGTRVDVKDLFASVPARMKFLKRPATEFGLVAETVRRFALGYPAVGFTLVHNGARVFEYPPVSASSERVAQVLGRDTFERLRPLCASHAGMKLEGYVSEPGVSHGSARRISLFVNRRWVKDRALLASLLEAYRTYLLRGRYPAASVSLEIAPGSVDVNVHPAKHEVRFSDPRRVHAFVVEAVRDCLRNEGGALGRWGLTADAMAARESTYRRRASEGLRARTESLVTDVRVELGGGGEPVGGEQSPDLPGYRSARAPAAEQVERIAGDTQADLIFTEAHHAGHLGRLHVVGQVLEGYLVCEDDGAVVLVDQHAAHERFLFERLLAAHSRGAVERQQLLLPVTVSVGVEGVEACGRHRDSLQALGWDVEPFGDEDIVVRATPALAASSDVRALAEEMASELADVERSATHAKLVESIVATVACHSAVRVGQRLDVGAARALLSEAGTVSVTASCPHGRPVAYVLGRAQLERLFGR